MSFVRSSLCLRAVALVLLLCAFAVRTAVPSGYMIGTGANGVAALQICPGQGPMPVMAAMHHGDRDDKDHGNKATDHPCAFAVAGAAVDLAATAHPLAATDRLDAPVSTPRRVARPGRGLAAPPPPKTGPPLLV